MSLEKAKDNVSEAKRLKNKVNQHTDPELERWGRGSIRMFQSTAGKDYYPWLLYSVCFLFSYFSP